MAEYLVSALVKHQEIVNNPYSFPQKCRIGGEKTARSDTGEGRLQRSGQKMSKCGVRMRDSLLNGRFVCSIKKFSLVAILGL
jgi:hypothetical protein